MMKKTIHGLKFPAIALLLSMSLFSCGGSKDSAEPLEIHCMDDFKGYSVATLQGSVYDLELSAQKGINLQLYNTIAEVMAATTCGKADCGLVDNCVVLGSDLKSMGMTGNDLDGFSNDVSVAFKKGANAELRESFNEYLKEIKSNGEFDTIFNRWCTGNAENQAMPEISLPEDGPPLKVAVFDDQVPFAFIKNGEYAGFEVELVMRWAEHIGRPLEITSMPFASMMASLQTGKVDAMLACLNITEERLKTIDFGDPYYVCKGFCLTKYDREETLSPLQWLKTGFQRNVLEEGRWKMLLSGLWETLLITLESLIAGTLLACLICCLRMRKNRLLNGFAKLYITFMRGIPILVLLMIMFYIVFAKAGLSPRWIAIIAFSLNFAAYVGEIFRGGIEGVDNGQWEAGWAMGFSKIKTFFYIIAPQAVKHIVPVYKGEAISLLKGTSIVGYIAIQDLTKVSDIIRGRTFDAFFPLLVITVVYFLMAWLIGIIIEKLIGTANPR